ncbi:SWI/SNF complex subunit SWI3D-like isoform X1 [Cucurbita moschata]|uniref:SWI/SNF complex subunit SWI3D-like isoform X1 n=1 Tax=Cucurbita moschata TaxID=3662 RepID=A0A6J1GJX9_CUCMO|nr:SWI/SNF complex subunit SWI3D-like isoform X1 [Cucurbita moschata]
MEDKRRDAGNLPANSTDSPSSEPPSSRRRAGAQKRKASTLGGSISSSAPSKRVTREKSALSHPPNHNGPFTRARFGPNNVAGAASANGGLASAAGSVKTEGSLLHSEVQRGDALVAAAEELNKATRLANLEASFEADFEAIKSRSANSHVVPNHCGWFSWTEVHPIEERSMPSFFSGKDGTRSPDIYIKIRNWIMKKFHANPSTQLEAKDLSEMEVGEQDARKEVMEFLDHWGLINFHPFLSAESISTSDLDDESQKDSLVEKLFHFETLESCPSIVPKINVTTAAPPRLLRESAISEEMTRPEGPSVEYHCNSCSADCSRKRYHCQKQADFDLCSECFNNGKFDSDMSSSDFILMESVGVPGASGGKWTDQETLLLLEALELYKENWNEIAEHVATKTKAQCILHFIQMPIEDTFLESEDNVEDGAKETVPPLTENDSSVPTDITESMDNKATEKEASNTETATKEDTGEVKVGLDNSKSEDVEGKAALDNSKLEDGDQKVSEDIALNALREAFEAIGYVLTPEHPLSFADVGNPVMALAAFLARLVGSDVASASARFSLKSVSQKSPSLELATRHCFILEDPPDDQKAKANSESIVNVEAQKNDKEQCAKQRPDNSTSVLDDGALSANDGNNKNGESVTKETIDNENSSDAIIEHNPITNHDSDRTSNLKELREPEIPEVERTGIVKESENVESKSTSNPVEKLGEGTSAEKPSQPKLSPKDVHMSDLQHAEKTEIQKQVPSHSAKTKKELDDEPNHLPSANEPQPTISANSVKEASKDVAIIPDSHNGNEPAKTETSKSVVDQEASKVADSLPSTENATPLPVKPTSVIERGAADDNQSKDNKEENSNCMSKKEDKIDKFKRAAVTTLSAAAVKAKILANQEEDQIRQLAMILIEKQLHKLESKLAFFNDMENVTVRMREQLDRSKQRLFQERAQIIAARLGLPASSSRGGAPTLPTNRMPMNFANTVPRPPMGMVPQRPPTSGLPGMAASNPNPQYPTTGTTISGSSFRPANQDTLSSVGSK